MMSRYTTFLFAFPSIIAVVACGGSKVPEAASPSGTDTRWRLGNINGHDRDTRAGGHFG